MPLLVFPRRFQVWNFHSRKSSNTVVERKGIFIEQIIKSYNCEIILKRRRKKKRKEKKRGEILSINFVLFERRKKDGNDRGREMEKRSLSGREVFGWAALKAKANRQIYTRHSRAGQESNFPNALIRSKAAHDGDAEEWRVQASRMDTRERIPLSIRCTPVFPWQP